MIFQPQTLQPVFYPMANESITRTYNFMGRTLVMKQPPRDVAFRAEWGGFEIMVRPSVGGAATIVATAGYGSARETSVYIRTTGATPVLALRSLETSVMELVEKLNAAMKAA